jgi:5-methylcytosine-specific restriction endonuclease McrA
MDVAVRKLVRQRAGNRCEYCGRRQEESPLATLHVEHIIPRKHGGDTVRGNLALACNQCNVQA